MDILGIILISMGLSLDICAVMISKGSVIATWKKKKMFLLALAYMCWQVIALISASMVRYIPAFQTWSESIAKVWFVMPTLIFAALGCYMIYKAVKSAPVIEHRDETFDWKQIFLMAILTSIDAACAGVGYGVMGTQLLISSICLAAATLAFGVLGAWIGYRIGPEHRHKVYWVSGALFFGAGLEAILGRIF